MQWVRLFLKTKCCKSKSYQSDRPTLFYCITAIVRIHAQILVNFGILPLTFMGPRDRERIARDDMMVLDNLPPYPERAPIRVASGRRFDQLCPAAGLCQHVFISVQHQSLVSSSQSGDSMPKYVQGLR